MKWMISEHMYPTPTTCSVLHWTKHCNSGVSVQTYLCLRCGLQVTQPVPQTLGSQAELAILLLDAGHALEHHFVILSRQYRLQSLRRCMHECRHSRVRVSCPERTHSSPTRSNPYEYHFKYHHYTTEELLCGPYSSVTLTFLMRDFKIRDRNCNHSCRVTLVLYINSISKYSVSLH